MSAAYRNILPIKVGATLTIKIFIHSIQTMLTKKLCLISERFNFRQFFDPIFLSMKIIFHALSSLYIKISNEKTIKSHFRKLGTG